MDKPSLRKEARRILKDFPHKKEESEKLCSLLMNNPHFINAKVILAFCPMKSEPDITPITDGRFLFPFTREDGSMGFAEGPLKKCSMGFMEPLSRDEIPYEKAVILVPGLLFTPDGRRLGRGGGFYDRYLAEHREKLHSIGLSFSVQLVGSIETEPHDEILDEVINPL